MRVDGGVRSEERAARRGPGSRAFPGDVELALEEVVEALEPA
jgi:hypothetical protein